MLATSAQQGQVPTPSGENTEGWSCEICFTNEEMDAALADYKPEAGSSPSIGIARLPMRALLDLVLAKKAGTA